MGIISKIAKLGLTGLGIKELNDYRKEVSAEGKDPLSPGVFIKHFGGKVTDSVKSILKMHESGKKNMNMGGMANARKKGMGLKMAEGGAVDSGLKPVPSGNKGLSQLPTPVRNKMGFMKKGGMAKKRVKSKSKKSRGTGAAIRGTKFKGVF